MQWWLFSLKIMSVRFTMLIRYLNFSFPFLWYLIVWMCYFYVHWKNFYWFKFWNTGHKGLWTSFYMFIPSILLTSLKSGVDCETWTKFPIFKILIYIYIFWKTKTLRMREKEAESCVPWFTLQKYAKVGAGSGCTRS